jgi:type IV/VI secretion system ImpK/VasF family protein
MSRTVANAEYPVVRAEIKEMLESIQRQAASDGRLAKLVADIEMPLIFFVDFMVIQSNLKFSNQWQQEALAFEHNELAGDEKFFTDYLEPTLVDQSELAAEKSAFYYVCLGLGFTGWHQGETEQLQKYMNQLYARMKPLNVIEADQTERVCKEAYEVVDTRNLVEPPGVKLWWILILFLVFMLLCFGAYSLMFAKATNKMRDAQQQLQEHNKAPAQ